MLSGSGILSQKFWEKEKVNFWEKVFDLYMMYKLRLVGAQRAGWGGGVEGGLNRPPLVHAQRSENFLQIGRYYS